MLAFALVVPILLPAAAAEITEQPEIQQETAPEPSVSAEDPTPDETESTGESKPPEPETLETIPEETAPLETVETAPEETAPEETVPPEPQKPQRKMPKFYQNDYPDVRYGNGTIATSGCAVVALAMVATYMTGHVYLPDELAEYFGDQVCNNNMERLEYGSDKLQLPWQKASCWYDVRTTLENGGVAIVLMNRKSAFTNSQHFIVLTGLTEDGKVLVNDPYLPNYDLWNLKDGFENGFPSGYITTGFDGAWTYDLQAMPEEPFIYRPPQRPEVEPRFADIQLSKSEIDLLAKMVWVEAQGEPFEGQQAVAEVVLNRMKSGKFPDKLSSVIYAENQFRSTPFISKAKPNQAQYVAVERALNGPYVLDEGVVFFATYPVNENVWGEIGGHTFCSEW